jgi:hypothetical protein
LAEGRALVYRAAIAVMFLVIGKLLDRGYAAFNTLAVMASIL